MKLKNSLMLGAIPLLFSSLALASGTLTLQKEIVPQVLNGEAITSSHFTAQNTLSLKEGENQLALTVGQIVFEDGKRRKFDSQPILLNFEAEQDQSLSIHYKTFRTIDDAKKFERSPELTFTTESGEAVQFELVQMSKGGLQGFRDFEREVADYNAKAGNEVTGQLKTVVPKSSVKSVAALQSEFADLNAEQQQEFMQWAMRNLK
ncbi:DUF2057 family protein [Vibrio profundi]|uniref:YccT family protein n=1 Tax=Vibrio profundi TaxID=1774960 RepID=UPI0037366EBA